MGRFLRFRLEIRGSTVEASGAKSEMWPKGNVLVSDMPPHGKRCI